MFDLIRQSTEYQKLKTALTEKGTTALFGLPPEGRVQMLTLLSEETNRPLVMVTAGEAEATR
ncbi:hypothetical protein EVA_21353, partial [gut metagenome]